MHRNSRGRRRIKRTKRFSTFWSRNWIATRCCISTANMSGSGRLIGRSCHANFTWRWRMMSVMHALALQVLWRFSHAYIAWEMPSQKSKNLSAVCCSCKQYRFLYHRKIASQIPLFPDPDVFAFDVARRFPPGPDDGKFYNSCEATAEPRREQQQDYQVQKCLGRLEKFRLVMQIFHDPWGLECGTQHDRLCEVSAMPVLHEKLPSNLVKSG